MTDPQRRSPEDSADPAGAAQPTTGPDVAGAAPTRPEPAVDRVAEIRKKFLSYRIVAFAASAIALAVYLTGAGRTLLDGWQLLFPTKTLLLKSPQGRVSVARNETLTLELEAILDSKAAVVVDDLVLGVVVTEEAPAGAGGPPPAARDATRSCDVEKAGLRFPPFDSKAGRASHKLHLTCHASGNFVFTIEGASVQLKRRAQARVHVQVMSWHMLCAEQLASSPSSPLRVLAEGETVNTFFSTVNELENLRVLVLPEAERADPKRAMLWLRSAFGSYAAGGFGYDVFASSASFSGASRDAASRCADLWPVLPANPGKSSFVYRDFLGPSSRGVILPIGLGVYALDMDSYGRISLRDVTRSACAPVPAVLLKSEGSLSDFKKTWRIGDTGLSATSTRLVSVNGQRFEESIAIGTHEGTAVDDANEPSHSDFPMVVPLGKAAFDRSESFLMVSDPDKLTVLACRRR